MPYRWTDISPSEKRLDLWPHRSLPRRGFAVFILITFALIMVPLVPLLGTPLLWGLLPFLLLAFGGVWWALEHSYRTADLCEVLHLTPEILSLVRMNRDGTKQDWQANSYWTRVETHQDGGPVPYYITLRGNDRTVEIGAFLSEDERRTLYGELANALLDLRRAASRS